MLRVGGTPPRPRAAFRGRARSRLSSCAGLTLFEIAIAMSFISVISLSLIAASVLIRRLTEVSVYQASVAAIVQGYVEQIKNMPYTVLPISPASGTNMAGSTYTSLYSITTQKDDTTSDALVLSPLPALVPSNLSPPTIPSAVYDNSKTFDVNRAGDLSMHIWVWIEDKTPSGYGATQQAKAIAILYMWQIQDGSTTRSYTGMIKSLRSLVPTF